MLDDGGKARHDRMVRLVETMMTADSLRLTAYSQEEDEVGVVERAADWSRHWGMRDEWE